MFRRIDDNKMNYSDQYEHLQTSSQKLSRCRVCLKKRSDLQNLFNSAKMNYASQIEQCALVDVREDDGFPQNICVDCIQLLETAHKFKILCEQSNQTLKLEALTHLEIKIENESIVENHTEFSATVKTEAQSNDNNGGNNFGMFDDVNTDQFGKAESLNDVEQFDSEYIPEQVKVSTVPKKPKKSKKPEEFKTNFPRPNVKKTPTKKLQCDECGYETVGPTSLEDHKRARHRGILDFYKCEHCPKGFTSQNLLQKHLNAVHVIIPISCETCGKTFKNKHSLNAHNITKHLSEKKYRCDYCSYMSITKSILQKHQRIHTASKPKHLCSICKKAFHSQYSLSTHIDQVHKDIRSFKCDECDKIYFNSRTLRQHKLVHSGQKSFICPLCPGTAYTWYSTLHGHNITAHPEYKLESEKVMYQKNMANLRDNCTVQNS